MWRACKNRDIPRHSRASDPKTRQKVSPIERAFLAALEEQLLVQTNPLGMRGARCKRYFVAEIGWVLEDNLD